MASERDTYRGNTIENQGCLFICMYVCLDVRMSFCTLTSRIFVLAGCSTLSQTSLNIIARIISEIKLFTALNSLRCS